MFTGAEGMDTLKNLTVVVFEVGEVGSHAAEALVRCGVSRPILVDDDTVPLANTNRQSTALHSIVRQFRTRVVKGKTADICPSAQAIIFEGLVLSDSIGSLSEHMELQMGQGNSMDCILDTIDTVITKLALTGFAASHGISATAPMDTGNKFYPEFLRISDISRIPVCPLCKMIRKELKAKNISEPKICRLPEQPPTPEQTAEDTGCCHAALGGISFASPVAGLVIAGTIIRDICGLG